MLTDNDVARIKALGLKNIVDLRSKEKRALAPTRPAGIRYAAIDYSMTTMIGDRRAMTNDIDLYRNFPTSLAPQIRIVFADLIHRTGPAGLLLLGQTGPYRIHDCHGAERARRVARNNHV